MTTERQQTPLQKLLWLVTKTLPDIGTNSYQDGFHDALYMVKDKIESLLPEEKNMIRCNYDEGYCEGYASTSKTGEDYFNETFQQ